MLVFVDGRKPDYPAKNPRSKEPTTNSTHIWRLVRDLNPGHIGGRQVLSPLQHPCSLLAIPALHVTWFECSFCCCCCCCCCCSRQEGWRLEPEDLSNPDSPMIFKGIVFNEMKGAMVRRSVISLKRNKIIILCTVIIIYCLLLTLTLAWIQDLYLFFC